MNLTSWPGLRKTSKQLRVLPVLFYAAIALLWPQGAAAAPSTHKQHLVPALYVANPSGGSISLFPLRSNGDVQSLMGRSGFCNPQGVAYFASKIYVTNLCEDSITVYPAGANGSLNPVLTIKGDKTRLDRPQAIALDSNGTIYIANGGSADRGHDSVTVYSATSTGNAAPIAEIAGSSTLLYSPNGIAVDSAGDIYVANQSSGDGGRDRITVYQRGATGNVKPKRVIEGKSTNLSQIGGIAIDASRNLYVTAGPRNNSETGIILIFAADSNGDVQPSSLIDTSCASLTALGSIVVDNNKNIYVDGFSRAKGAIAFLSRSSMSGDKEQCVSPGFEITGSDTRLTTPAGLAVDEVGDIYVVDADTESLLTFQTGQPENAAPSAVVATPNQLTYPAAVAVDQKGEIYVANRTPVEARSLSSISVFPSGSNTNSPPIATIGMGSGSTITTGVLDPAGLTTDPSGNLYVANAVGGPDSTGSIDLFRRPADGDLFSDGQIDAKTDFSNPLAVKTDQTGNLYVLDSSGGPGGSGGILVYSPDANQGLTLKATIADGPGQQNTQITAPAGLALDKSANIFVTNDGDDKIGPSVTVYQSGSSGAVRPKAIISGSLTGLNQPQGIAVDADGYIYVANQAADHGGKDKVTIYSPNATGDVAPVATIAGPHTGLAGPTDVTIGLADLSSPPSRLLTTYDWSVKASPNLQQQPPDKSVVEDFVRAFEIVANGQSDLGTKSDVCWFKFTDLRHDGSLSLAVTATGKSDAHCNTLRQGGFFDGYIVNRNPAGFEIYRVPGLLGVLGDPSQGLKRLDSRDVILVDRPFAPYGMFSRDSSARCFSVFPAIYAWTGVAYANVSDQFKNYYQQQLDSLDKTVANLPSSGDQPDRRCLEATIAKFERFLGKSPDAGLSRALEFASSSNRDEREFAVYLLANIGTAQALTHLTILTEDHDKDVAFLAKQGLSWPSMRPNPLLPPDKLELLH